MGILKKLVKGEYSLAVTFWGFEFLINTVILFILFRFLLFISSPFLFIIMLSMLIVIKTFLSIIIFIGIYSLIKKNDDLFWGVIALILPALDITGILFGAVKVVQLIL